MKQSDEGFLFTACRFATKGCHGLVNTTKLCPADWEVNAGALLGAVRAEADRDVNLDEVRQSVIDQELSRHVS